MSAEAAVALPALVAVAAFLVCLVCAAATQVRCTDAARSGARQAARSASAQQVSAVARRAAGADDAQVTVRSEGPRVRVSVRLPVRGLPGWAGRWWVSATAVAEVEPGQWTP